MSSIYDWSTTPGNNGSSDGEMTWAEGMAPSAVNNSARQLVARVAELVGDISGALEAGGTANGLTVTANSSFTSYADGRIIAFKAASDNTGAATLNVNAIGAKAIRIYTPNGDSAIPEGAIQEGGIYLAIYSAGANSSSGGWVLLNPTASIATIAASGSPISTVYTGSSPNATDFPIGHTIPVVINDITTPDKNALIVPRIGSPISYVANNGSGTALTGTWRSRGLCGNAPGGNAIVLAERVA